MLHYTLQLELELNGLAISFTTLDHRLELFIQVSTDNRESRNVKRQQNSPLPNLPKLPQEIAEGQPCQPRCSRQKP
jgi:hypothetical protein